MTHFLPNIFTNKLKAFKKFSNMLTKSISYKWMNRSCLINYSFRTKNPPTQRPQTHTDTETQRHVILINPSICVSGKKECEAGRGKAKKWLYYKYFPKRRTQAVYSCPAPALCFHNGLAARAWLLGGSLCLEIKIIPAYMNIYNGQHFLQKRLL